LSKQTASAESFQLADNPGSLEMPKA
jgi:hypothetical protein